MDVVEEAIHLQVRRAGRLETSMREEGGGQGQRILRLELVVGALREETRSSRDW